ncbi:MAG TPA: histidine kinase [Mobilitalea sp.]|nr:histidine kinase [Mobilitalea sp.]
MEKAMLYFITKIVSVLTSIFLLEKADVDVTFLVISTLSFACVFVLEILLNKIYHNNRVIMVTNGVILITCFALGMEVFLPLFVISVVHVIDMLTQARMFYYILTVAMLLIYMIFMPGRTASLLILTLLAMIIFSRIMINRLLKYQSSYEKQKEMMIEQKQKITDMKSLMKTIKYTVSIEERNRIAARIHDQLGHGISGSIILLEASMLIMKDNPDKAADTVQKAITNLREGVDEIRASLRDERVVRYLIGKNDTAAMLEKFRVNYNKAAVFHTSGDLDMISLEIWACIHDNVKECLTNMLKHSNAAEFTLNIEVFKKIIKVEYKDNGTSSEDFEKGIGLEAIEERTINAHGRCFFTKGEKGFCVTNIFTY